MRFPKVVFAILMALCFAAAASAQGQCSLYHVRGVWGFNAMGWAIASDSAGATPVVVLGVITIDNAGKMTGPLTVISGAPIPGTPIPAGAVLEFDFVDASVEVTPDCTGIWKYALQLKGTPGPIPGHYVERIVVVPDKDEILFLSIQSPLSKPMWTGSAKRMFQLPRPVAWPAFPPAN